MSEFERLKEMVRSGMMNGGPVGAVQSSGTRHVLPAPPPAEIRRDCVADMEVQAHQTRKAVNKMKGIRDGSDSEEELNIWQPGATQAETLESMAYFNDANFASLKRREKKESMANFYSWLDKELSGIVAADQAAMDALF